MALELCKQTDGYEKNKIQEFFGVFGMNGGYL